MTTQTEKFVDDVLARMGEFYVVNGKRQQGQAVSFLLTAMRQGDNPARRSWTIPGGIAGFESELERAGFRVVDGRNSRGQRTRVVTL
jgi:hypothetical protein